MPQTIKISSPLKGINRAFGREAQPANTCFDALNVMPFDRYGRMRLSQRSGIGLLDTLANAEPVRCLHVASSAHTPEVTPGSVVGPVEPFTYSNGALTSQGGWIAGTNLGVPSMVVTSNQISGVGTDGSNGNSHPTFLDPVDFSIGEEWTIEFVCTLNGSGGDPLAPAQELIVSVGDAGLLNGIGWIRISNVSGAEEIILEDVFGDAGVANVPFAWDVPHTIRVTATYMGTGVTMPVAVSIDGDDIPMIGFGIGGPAVTTDLTIAVNMTDDGWSWVLNSVTAGVLTDPVANVTKTLLQLVGTSGDTVYVGTPTDMNAAVDAGTYPIDDTALFVSAATLFGYTYIVDGNGKPKRLRLSDKTMIAFTESAGTAPSDCTIACSYRGRLILAGNSAEPQNFFASKVGDPLNFDYGASSLPTSAYSGNDSDSGHVGQPIQALIPMSDDLLVIGLEQSIWKMTGDISNGGSLMPVTEFAGISQANAWTRTPDGSLYFVGPRGFFKMDAGASSVQEISEFSYPQFFQNVNRQTHYINMMYDADRYGIWIFVSPLTQGATSTSIFYHLPTQSLWSQNFSTQLNAGPLACVWWDGYDSDTRYPVLGGFDGGLYGMNATNRTDNGGTISAYVVLGPISPSDVDATLIGATFNLGELSPADLSTPSRWNSNFSLYAGKSAYAATEGTADSQGIVTWGAQGRTKTLRQRLRGKWFTVKLSNSAASNYFSFESVELEFNTTGRNRKQGL